MGARQLYHLFPWRGGLSTSVDPSQVPFNQLIRADHIQMGPNGSRKKREGINYDFDDQTSGSDDIIGGLDFWYGNSASRTQKYVVVTEGKKIYTYNTSTGARSADAFAGTAWATAPTRASFSVLNNLAVITVDGSNAPKKYDGTNVADLGGTPPNGTFSFIHQGRVLMNDPSNPDRLHYSPPFDAETWNGVGDSGAVDIFKGDGDPQGLTGGFSWLGTAYVGKRNRLYRIEGEFPDVSIKLISTSIGIESHDSIVVIEDSEVAWCSARGFHSLAAVQQYGDLKSTYLSKDIQTEFNEDFVRSRLKYVKGVYIPWLNSVAWAVTNDVYSTSANNCIYLWNPEDGWYRWPNISCQALFSASDVDRPRFYIGTATGRLAKGMNDTIYDVDESGTNAAIAMDIETGRISIDGTLVIQKAFKGLHLIHKPEGSFTITVTFTVDGFAGQSLAFTGTGGSDLLGTTFILGSSLLGSTLPVGAYGQSVDGLGHTFSVRIRNSGINERVEIMGLAVTYEMVGDAQEVLARDADA